MTIQEMTASELEMAEIIWEEEPLKSTRLVEICQEKFAWKKSTTYTLLRRIEKKKIVENQNSIIRCLVSRDDYFAIKGEKFVEENFGGSLPKFLTTFTRKKKLTSKEVQEIQDLIDNHREG